MEKVLKAGIIDIPNFKSILAHDSKRWEKFLLAIENFTPGKKGFEGGLKAFSKELGQEINELLQIIEKYKSLKFKKRVLSSRDMKQLKILEKKIPMKIRKEWKRGPKGLALKWMASYYPCSKSTLLHIIRYNPK